MTLTILFLLNIKHYLADWVYQTQNMIDGKGIYGNLMGIAHSLLHGVLTAIVFIFFTDFVLAVCIGILDFLLHYHIDYIKMKFGCQDIREKKFWNHIGLDQLAHNQCYLFYTLLV